MRDPNRIKEVCNQLAEVWEKNIKDWRLTQLFCNLQRYAGWDLFYMEDDEFIKLLQEYFRDGDE